MYLSRTSRGVHDMNHMRRADRFRLESERAGEYHRGCHYDPCKRLSAKIHIEPTGGDNLSIETDQAHL
jgi:hypothetical protein